MAWLGLDKSTLEEWGAAYMSWHPRAWPVLVRPDMEEAGTASPARFHRACTVLGNLNVEEVGAAYLSLRTLWRLIMERGHTPAMDECNMRACLLGFLSRLVPHNQQAPKKITQRSP